MNRRETPDPHSWSSEMTAAHWTEVGSDASAVSDDQLSLLDEHTTPPAANAGSRPTLGWIPALLVSSAVGLLLVAIADASSRKTESSSQTLFWLGLLILYIPLVYRVASSTPTRNERVVLILMLGVALYLVKIFFAPFGFTYADELAHEPNVNAILRTHELFTANSILPVTPFYPGLEAVTAAVAAMSGLTAFGAGLLVIGAARLVMMLALFLLFETLTKSPRLAAVGTAIYVGNANFVFFDAQFSYESLALPLLIAVLAFVADWQSSARRTRGGWTGAILLIIFAIVVTHHVATYALIGLLFGVCIASVLRGRIRDTPIFAPLFATALAAFWIATVARPTVGYLKPVLVGAVTSTIHTASGQSTPRALFSSSSYQPSILERAVGVGSILILLAAFPLGVRVLRRTYSSNPFVVVLAFAGGGFFVALVMRYAPEAWETANRASEYLFIGLAMVVAMVNADRWVPRWPSAGIALGAGVLAIVFAGGVISGAEPELRLAQPYLISAGGHSVQAEGRQMAAFAATELPSGARYGASAADARLLATYAGAFAIEGKSPDIYDVLQEPDFPTWQRQFLQQHRLAYVVVDRRDRSFDNTSGYYFGVPGRPGVEDRLLATPVAPKFDAAGFSRLYDSGNIVIFKRRSS